MTNKKETKPSSTRILLYGLLLLPPSGLRYSRRLTGKLRSVSVSVEAGSFGQGTGIPVPMNQTATVGNRIAGIDE